MQLLAIPRRELLGYGSLPREQTRDFLACPRRGQLERFVDVDVALGDASRGVTQERGDRQLGEAEVTSDAAEGMSQGVGCDALDLRRGAGASGRSSLP